MNTSVNPDRAPRLAFAPRRLVRSANAQTLLAMLPPRNVDVTADEVPLLLDAGCDHTGMAPERPVQLLGYYNASRQPYRRGLVMILHGWEGCSHSNYNRLMAQKFVEAGYDVLRMNLRDHGPGLHVDPYALNRGLFLGTLIEEAAAATQQVARLAGDVPFYIFGASMGGNFALRLAIWHSEVQPIHNLARVVTVCPAISPGRATDALDSHRGPRFYFRSRWMRSLRAKQRLYPEIYDFTGLDQIGSVRAMTDWFVAHYSHLTQDRFPTADAYFRAYSTLGDAFANLAVPTTIIAAMNDPVIPVADFYALQPHPLLDVQIQRTGGHVGFMDLPARSWLPDLVLPELEQTTHRAVHLSTPSPP